MMGGWQNKQVLKYVNMTELQDTINPYSYRVTKDECLDLPEQVYRKLTVEMTSEQRKVYEQMRDEMTAELEGMPTVNATIALTVLLRLQQIVGGFLPASEEDRALGREAYRPIPGGNPKLDALLEDLEEVPDGSKVLIWAKFRAELDIVAKAVADKYGRESVAEFHGGVHEKDRTERRKLFQDRDHPLRFLVLQIDTGGVGLTLTAADRAYYFSNGFSLESRLQSEARNHRSGSEIHAHITYTDLVMRGTIDAKLLNTLRKKLSLANIVTGDNWKEWM
jgi:SNF2 family DNA or RNA helicase